MHFMVTMLAGMQLSHRGGPILVAKLRLSVNGFKPRGVHAYQ